MAGKTGALATIRQIRIEHNERENVISLKRHDFKKPPRRKGMTWGGAVGGG